MTDIVLSREVIEGFLSMADAKSMYVAIPVAVKPSWEPPHVTEMRIMWNATWREPYWPEPNIHTLKAETRLLQCLTLRPVLDFPHESV